MPATAIVQHRLYDLLPGSPGGRTIRDLRGSSYFSSLGSLGGLQTVQRYGIEHMRRLAERSAQARRQRRYTLPVTVQYLDGDELVVERRVPWWPHQPQRRRRKRPVLVYIETSRVSV